MTEYTRLTLNEREKIYLCLREGKTITKIGAELGRHKSTISRELRRFKGDDLGYLPDKSHAQYRFKLARNKLLFTDKKLRDYVIHQLTVDRWSPEQISGRMKQQKMKNRVSTETIYKFIYSNDGITLNLPIYLKQRRKKRGFRKSRKTGGSRIIDLVPIKNRPKHIDKRKNIGHWEGDLVIFGTTRPCNISTLVERKTRYTKIIVNNSKRTDEVISKIQNSFSGTSLPFKSITFDRGTEFASHYKLDAKTYFCNPGAPWQKGTVENTNGRIRQFMPKHKIPYLLKQEFVDQVAFLLNNTPRKVLGFKTPLELMNANLNAILPDRCASN